MSASMAEEIAGVLELHQPYPRALRHMECHGCDWKSDESPAMLTIGQRAALTAAHQAEALAAAGYGKLEYAWNLGYDAAVEALGAKDYGIGPNPYRRPE